MIASVPATRCSPVTSNTTWASASRPCQRLAALQAAGRECCDSILDLPSGHGRRVALAARKVSSGAHHRLRPESCRGRLVRTDLERAAGLFGERYPRSDPGRDLPNLIWCGSLLASMLARLGDLPRFLRAASCTWRRAPVQHTRPPVCRLVARRPGRLRTRPRGHRWTGRALPPRGFGYRDYPRRSDYGISLVTPHRVLGLLQIRRELGVSGTPRLSGMRITTLSRACAAPAFCCGSLSTCVSQRGVSDPPGQRRKTLVRGLPKILTVDP